MQLYSILFVSAILFRQESATDISPKDRFATPCLTPNYQPAHCIELQKCSILYNEVINRNNDSVNFIRASSCGPANQDHSQPKVCCGSHYDYVNKNITTTTPTTITTPLRDNILPKKCGKQDVVVLNNRIFGGTEADLGEFPWMARLQHKNKYNYTTLGCSGFLIHKRFVLTAAHCLRAKALEPLGPVKAVALGVHSDIRKVDCVRHNEELICNDPPIVLEVDDVIVHRNYDPTQHMHDIALLRLRRRVDQTKYIKPICLSYNSTDQKELWLSGWGRTEEDAISSVKRKVSVPRVDINTCAEKYQRLNMNIRETQICAGGVIGIDSCTGDSGGPLMAIGRKNMWYAEGIVSYGSGCGRKDWPGVYTNVPKYVNWIIEKISSYQQTKDGTDLAKA